MRTSQPGPAGGERKWHVIDANDRVLGRMASVIARLLQGKHKPHYVPFLDVGDPVIVINAARVKLTGRKDTQKLYRSHSGYEGGLREDQAGDRATAVAHPPRGRGGAGDAAQDEDG